MMPQRDSGNSPWSIDEEAQEFKDRLADLMSDGRMTQSDAIRQIAVEDNQQLVQMNIEKQAAARQQAWPAREQPEPAPEEAVSQEPSIEPEQSPAREVHPGYYNDLKLEHAEAISAQLPEPDTERILTFAWDRDDCTPQKYDALKREHAESVASKDQGCDRTLNFAWDRDQGQDRSR